MVFWGKKKKKDFLLQRPQGSICGLMIFFIPKNFFIDAVYRISRLAPVLKKMFSSYIKIKSRSPEGSVFRHLITKS